MSSSSSLVGGLEPQISDQTHVEFISKQSMSDPVKLLERPSLSVYQLPTIICLIN
jgi:hypothetical protein